jgi:hypothetical protein
LHTCAPHVHQLIQNFPYLFSAQNNFYNLILVPAINKL